MDKKSFLIYLEYEEQFNLLTDEEAGKLIKIIFKYERTGEIPKLDGAIKMAFSFIKQQLDRNTEKWEKERKKRSEAGKKGMLERWKNKKENNNTDNNVKNSITTDNSVKNVITKNNSVKNVITRHNKNN